MSSAEQQDYLPSVVGESSAWLVLALGLSPLLVVIVVSVICLFSMR